MKNLELITNVVITNFPTLVVVCIAVFLLPKQGKYSLHFITGLVILLLAGIAALPLSNYMWSHHQALMSNSSLVTTGLVLFLGTISSAGLGLCLYAFYKRGTNA